MKGDKVRKPLTADPDNPHVALQGVSMIVAVDEFFRRGLFDEALRMKLHRRVNGIAKMLITGKTVGYNNETKQYEIVKETD